jgi:hypothetical protein
MDGRSNRRCDCLMVDQRVGEMQRRLRRAGQGDGSAQFVVGMLWDLRALSREKWCAANGTKLP